MGYKPQRDKGLPAVIQRFGLYYQFLPFLATLC